MTVSAAVGLLSSVDALVRSEVVLACKLDFADAAFVGFLPRMDSQVGAEPVCSRELSVADTALGRAPRTCFITTHRSSARTT